MGDRMDAALARLRALQAGNLEGGGREHIDRQHARGKLTARERIDRLLDPGTFAELGSSVNTTGRRIDGREVDAPCDGAVIGTGTVEGRPVAVYASDFTVLGGSLGCQHGMKFIRLIEMAAGWGIPMVWLLDSSGGRLGYQDVPSAGIDWWFALQSRFSGVIPQINVLMGPCIAGQAYCPTLCDFLLMSRRTAHLWLGGPRMTQAATSERIGDNVGGADYHMEYSGTCDVVGTDDADTIRRARELLGYLPSNWQAPVPVKRSGDPVGRDLAALEGLVPDEGPYDMHAVVGLLVDDGVYYEIKEGYARQLITCFARFDGRAVGMVASNPAVAGSALAIDACDKYYRFLQVLKAYNLPLVTLIDTPRGVPGEDEETRGLLRHVGKLVDAYATATIPKISVVLREAYGDAGSLVMGGVKGMGVDLAFAWPAARLAVESSTLDYHAVCGKGIEADALKGYLGRARRAVDVFDAARSWSAQVVDEIIAPQETRRRLVEALALTADHRLAAPPVERRRGTPPT